MLIDQISQLRVWILLLVLVGLGLSANGEKLSRYITDQTGSLKNSELEAIEAKLSEFDRTTSTQIVVLIVSTIESGSIEDASLRIAEENGIGQKGKNNGVLLLVAKNDRKIRIEVGYGLEGVLTDAVSGQIIRKEIAPRFREGQFLEGVLGGVEAIMLATKGEYSADRSAGSTRGLNVLPIVLIIMAFIFFSRLRRRRFVGGGVPPIFFPGGGWGRGSGGWGGGGGGFSGGGGSFGGGGASGSW